MQDTRIIKECLDSLLENSDTVFIVPHNRPDMDALGAAIGMALICKKKKKRNYIIIDDNIEKLESATKKVIEDISHDFDIIKASDLDYYISNNSLLIAVDVNKEYLVSVQKDLDKFSNIFLIDHHRLDEHSIKTPNLFVDEKISSTCEEVSRLLFQYNVKLTPDQANYLLAGIILDTNKMSKNVGADTYSIAAKLTNSGADANVASNMFLEDFEHDRAIQRLVDNTCFPQFTFAIASDKPDSGKIYDPEDIAKASDYLLKYQVNATFALAFIDESTVSISARSKGIIDVSKVMKLFGGGGNEHSAAAKVKGMSIEEIKGKLIFLLTPTYCLDLVDLNSEEVMKLILK